MLRKLDVMCLLIVPDGREIFLDRAVLETEVLPICDARVPRVGKEFVQESVVNLSELESEV